MTDALLTLVLIRFLKLSFVVFHVLGGFWLSLFDIVIVLFPLLKGWANYGYYIATALSLLEAQFVRHLLRVEERDPIYAAGRSDSLESQVSVSMRWCRENKRGSHHTLCGFAARGAVSGSLAASLALFIIGVIEPCSQFDIRGFAGLLAKPGSLGPTSTLSVLDIGNDISVQAWVKDGKWYSVQYWFFAIVVIAPILSLVIAMLLWLLPSNIRTVRRIYLTAETVRDWSGLGCFMLVLVTCIGQISLFANYILGSQCAAFNPLLDALLGSDLGGYASCFDLVPRFKHGAWALLCATLLGGSATAYVLEAARSVLRENGSGTVFFLPGVSK